MTTPKQRSKKAFSLLELVIVIVIIGIIAAIAVPRMSRGSAGAADSALKGSLAVMRNAIELYSAEHEGKLPTVADFEAQMTGYTDVNGVVSPSGAKTTPYIYGPYMRTIPPLPVGAKKDAYAVSDADAGGVGWIYNETTGAIKANTTDTEKDITGTLYSSY